MIPTSAHILNLPRLDRRLGAPKQDISETMEGLLKSVREEAWDGLIPAEFSMDSAEVTALQRPLPLYYYSVIEGDVGTFFVIGSRASVVTSATLLIRWFGFLELLLPRMGFLPCVAETVSHHFGEAAPEAQRTLWLEEASSGEPLRWHIPTGVLFDLLAGIKDKRDRGAMVAGDESRGDTTEQAKTRPHSVLPWRITVHFQGCPRRQVFPLEKEVDIRRHYTNALKQALYLQLGSSRAGMSLAKDKQTRLWQAVKTNDAKVFHEIDVFLAGDGALRLVPVRLLRGSNPPAQLPIPTERPSGGPFTLRDCLCWLCPDLPWESAFDRQGSGDAARGNTIDDRKKSLPQEAAPALDKDRWLHEAKGAGFASAERGFEEGTESSQAAPNIDDAVRVPAGPSVGVEGPPGTEAPVPMPRILVQGTEPPLDASVAQLWTSLRHPDHFLYVVLRKP